MYARYVNKRTGMRDSTTTLGAQPEPESYFPRDPWCFAINTRISKCARWPARLTTQEGREGGKREHARPSISRKSNNDGGGTVFVNRTGLVFAILAGNNRGSGRKRPSSRFLFTGTGTGILNGLGDIFVTKLTGGPSRERTGPTGADKRPPVLSRMKYQQ